MIVERDLARFLVADAKQYPAITLTGPRQSGKTTLCQTVFPEHRYVRLEDPDVRQYALEDPRGFLAELPDGAILDEIQRAPDIPSYLQSIIDDDPAPGKWILTGSENLSLSQSISQSLAGRTSVRHLFPLSYSEVQRFRKFPVTLADTLLTGSFPRILHRGVDSVNWYRSYIATYVERDARMLLNIGNLTNFQRFLQLCATRSAQQLNYASLAGDCGLSQPTAKSWTSLLEASYLVHRLLPVHRNLGKRITKMPKLHFIDTGLLCNLLGIRTADQLRSHPLFGAIFETWVVSEVFKRRHHESLPKDLFYYRDSNGAEVDLVIESLESVDLIDAKSSMTASTSLFSGIKRAARHFQSVDCVNNFVVYGGNQTQQRSVGTLIPWTQVNQLTQ